MFSLSPTNAAAAQHSFVDYTRRQSVVNWGLIAALAINAAVWAGVIALVKGAI